ncbi:MAG: hypothetical protein ABUK01_08795 [Leptospirales bacterium]
MKKKFIALFLLLIFIRGPLNGLGNLNNLSYSGNNMGAASSIASIVVLAVTTGVASAITSIGFTLDAGKGSGEALMRYMKANHVQLKHDFSLANGAFFKDIAYELALTSAETHILEAEFEGSVEQQSIMQSLNGKITLEKAGFFSRTLTNYLLKALGPHRMVEIFAPRLLN